MAGIARWLRVRDLGTCTLQLGAGLGHGEGRARAKRVQGR